MPVTDRGPGRPLGAKNATDGIVSARKPVALILATIGLIVAVTALVVALIALNEVAKLTGAPAGVGGTSEIGTTGQ